MNEIVKVFSFASAQFHVDIGWRTQYARFATFADGETQKMGDRTNIAALALPNVDPTYLIALYLGKKGDAVDVQSLVSDMLDISNELFDRDIEVAISFNRDAGGKLVSAEITSALNEMQRSGLVVLENRKQGNGVLRYVHPLQSASHASDIRSHQSHLGQAYQVVCRVVDSMFSHQCP